MKSTDLRIGNYIYQGGKYGKVRVTAYELYNYNTLQNGGAVAEYYKEWQPIPITEEELIKLGAERIYKSNIHSAYLVNKIATYYFWYDNPKQYLTIGGIQVNCPYVHQLQNLIFAITEQDIEYNKTPA